MKDQDLITQLTRHPTVLGIVRYGSRPTGDTESGGDLDLFVLVDDRPPDVESVHFYVGDLPIDLNIRMWEDLAQAQPMTPIDATLVQGEIVYDRDGDLESRLHALALYPSLPAPLSSHDIAFIRFGARHSLDKARGRLEREPIVCRFLLESTVFWLVHNYFLVRSLEFPGDRRALRYLEQHELTLWEHIQQFYASSDVSDRLVLAQTIGDYILAPIGGLWKQDEIVTFGTATHDLQEAGQRYLQTLLDTL